jgi:hypothetical protein
MCTLNKAPKYNGHFIAPIEPPVPLIMPKSYIHICGREYIENDFRNNYFYTCTRCNIDFLNPYYCEPEPKKIGICSTIFKIIKNIFNKNIKYTPIYTINT